jgi:hypothetical protein
MQPITEASYPFALAKKHPWMLFCRGGDYVAHRKQVFTKSKEIPPITVAFHSDLLDIPAETRQFFLQTIADMKALSSAPTARLTKADK